MLWAGGSCSSLNNTSFDLTPPNITINAPLNSWFYESKSILLDIELDEKADLYYLDNIQGADRWTRICTECDFYNREKSFKEGFNNLTFKAVDFLGQESYKTRTFNIDSQAPRIHKTEPRSDYADGKFEIQYSEENIKNIIIYYGNEETGFRNKKLINCTNGSKQWCFADVNLNDYDNERISYYFEVEDIMGRIKKSQIRQNLNVDTTFPVLNNPGSYYTQGTGRDSRYVYFLFNVTEINLYKITYSYLDSRNITKEAVLCSRLKNNICEIKKSFSKGSHNVDIQITDKAGNAIGKQLGFEVDY